MTTSQRGYEPNKNGSRGAIGCRTHLVTEVPDGAKKPDEESPFQTAMSRNHDAERKFARTIERFEPAFVKLDNVVLRFYAWFSNEIHESQAERMRVRKVSIDYTVLDGTIMIYEIAEANSGHLQGQLLKRQRVPVDYRNPEAGFIGISDLKIKHSVNIFGTVYNLYACTEDTRIFLTNEGIEVEADVPATEIPEDEYSTSRRARHMAETQKSIVT